MERSNEENQTLKQEEEERNYYTDRQQEVTEYTMYDKRYYIYIYIYTGCPRRNGQNFGRVFLMLNYTDITQNTYIQS